MRSIVRFLRDNIRAVLVVLAVILLLILMVGGVFLWEHLSGPSGESSNGNSSSAQTGAVEYIDGKPYKLKSNIDTVLFLGVDKYEDQVSSSYINNQQADLVMLLVLDHNTQTYTMVQFNRDTMAPITTLGVTGDNAGTVTAQLALAHAYGTGSNDSSRNVTKSVSKLMYGVDIDHYLTLKLDAVSILNDAVGGVEVELLDDFTHLDPSFTKGATVLLRGDDATSYVRARGELDDSSNTSRMERQKQYMSTWSKTLDTRLQEDKTLPLTILTSVSPYLVTDLSNEQIQNLVDDYNAYTSLGIVNIAGESVKGEEYMEFHVDESALRDMVIELFYVPAE